jgi:hypothetical protein
MRKLKSGDRRQKHPTNELVPSFQESMVSEDEEDSLYLWKHRGLGNQGPGGKFRFFNSATPELLQLLKNTRF